MVHHPQNACFQRLHPLGGEGKGTSVALSDLFPHTAFRWLETLTHFRVTGLSVESDGDRIRSYCYVGQADPFPSSEICMTRGPGTGLRTTTYRYTGNVDQFPCSRDEHVERDGDKPTAYGYAGNVDQVSMSRGISTFRQCDLLTCQAIGRNILALGGNSQRRSMIHG